jgi:hypothetical protein
MTVHRVFGVLGREIMYVELKKKNNGNIETVRFARENNTISIGKLVVCWGT